MDMMRKATGVAFCPIPIKGNLTRSNVLTPKIHPKFMGRVGQKNIIAFLPHCSG